MPAHDDGYVMYRNVVSCRHVNKHSITVLAFSDVLVSVVSGQVITF